MRWTRRRFLGGSVAAVCVGCSSDAAEPASSDTTPVPSRSTTTEARVAATALGSLTELRAAAEPVYVPEHRAWLVALDDDEAAVVAASADESLRPGLEHGLILLAEKCPHLGCRVPYCTSSGWFECMCHGTMFNRVGEHRDGPGPRGLDALPIVVDGDVVSIASAGGIVRGAPVGTIVLDQPPSGPHCVGEAGH